MDSTVLCVVSLRGYGGNDACGTAIGPTKGGVKSAAHLPQSLFQVVDSGDLKERDA